MGTTPRQPAAHCQSQEVAVGRAVCGTANLGARFNPLELRLALFAQGVHRREERGKPRDRDYDVKAREEPRLRCADRHVAIAHG